MNPANYVRYFIYSLVGLLSVLSLKAQIPRLVYLKFNPSTILRGDIEFGMERCNRGSNSFEFSLGLTVKNLIFEESHPELFREELTPVEKRKNSPGWSAKIAYRYFLNKGLYLSPQVAYITHSYKFPLVNMRVSESGFQKESLTYRELRFLLGYRFIFLGDALQLDMYAGAGLKQRNINFVEEQGHYDSNKQYIYEYGTYKSGNKVPGMYYGLKVGWLIFTSKK
jgi:hypothetical protein